MLDNIEGAELVRVAQTLKEKWKGKRKFLLETSGNITETNLQERAINGALLERQLLKTFLLIFLEIDVLSTSAVQTIPKKMSLL